MVNKEDIIKIFDDLLLVYDIKCSTNGSKPSSGVIRGKGEAPRYELNDGGLTNELLNQIADDMAERWGLEVSIDEKGDI